MGPADRFQVLAQLIRRFMTALLLWLNLAGCGLIVDAIGLIHPFAKTELDAICARHQLRIGIAVEPFQPFVFPAIYTDEGVRITGLDVELVREISAAFSERCGGQEPIVPTLHLVRFRNLFIELTEGNVDFFVSSISANAPALGRIGLDYSSPYFFAGGIGGITPRMELAEQIRAKVGLQPVKATEAFSGLTVAVQEGTSAQFYAESNLPGIRLVLCDSLPAALESKSPPIDIILGKEPVLEYTVRRSRKDWHLLRLDGGKPLVLTREQYAIVTDEQSYRLRRFLNDLLFRLEESGRLADMRRRWLEEDYAYPRRAATEGLPFDAAKMPQHYDQGQCRLTDHNN